MKTTEKQKIFVVTSQILDQQLLKEVLNKLEEVEIEEFSTLDACLEKMQEQPSLVILDYYLNPVESDNLNAYQALNSLQSDDVNQPVLFISTESDGTWLEEYRVYRTVDFVIESRCTKRRILNKVEQYLKAA